MKRRTTNSHWSVFVNWEVYDATSAVPIGQKHKHKSSPAGSANTAVGPLTRSPEPGEHFSASTFETTSHSCLFFHLFYYIRHVRLMLIRDVCFIIGLLVHQMNL